MKQKNILWLYLFLLLGILDIFLVANNHSEWRWYSKPFLLPTLLAYFISVSRELKGSYLRISMIAALIFSWMGDVLLMFQDFFIYGLGAFLMAHLCYTIAFKISQKDPFAIRQVNFVKLFFNNFPIYLLAALAYFLISPGLGQMKIPVIAYLVIIVLMATTARERFGKTVPESFWQVMIGAFVFMVSDAILAINLFYKAFPEAGVIVMGTYIIAQLLIVRGIQRHYQ